MDGTVLIADDDRTIRTVLSQALTRAGCKVRTTANIATLWRWIEDGQGDVVVSDVMLPDGNGLELVPMIRRKRPELPVIVISAQNTVITAIRASEVGAFDYIPKPFDLSELLSKVHKGLAQSIEGNVTNAEQPDKTNDLPLVGRSPAMQEVYRLVARVINTNLNIIINGESGTGKNLLASSLHHLGNRSHSDYLELSSNTVTIQDLKKALTDLGDDTLSKNATIYLDEIADLKPDVQSYLLEIMDSDFFKAQNYRIISSTRIAPLELVNNGTFREDLFYRLNVVPIQLPALRDRSQDIADLVEHFATRSSLEGLGEKRFNTKAVKILTSMPWPGNVRELENVVMRLMALCPEEEITSAFVKQHLSEQKMPANPQVYTDENKLSQAVEMHIRRYFDLHGDSLPPPGLYNRILKEVELPLIALSLAATRGNQIKTAELLGINRNTLRKKITDLEIQVTRGRKMM